VAAGNGVHLYSLVTASSILRMMLATPV
jgi:hypothetical protein